MKQVKADALMGYFFAFLNRTASESKLCLVSITFNKVSIICIHHLYSNCARNCGFNYKFETVCTSV